MICHQFSKNLVPLVLLFLTAASSAKDSRTPDDFQRWKEGQKSSIFEFEQYLVDEKLDSVIPLYELLKSASDWKRCNAQPFSVPPKSIWPSVRSVLLLVRELRTRGILPEFEIHSAYRNERLNHCAKGAPASAHLTAFAIDLSPLRADPSLAPSLCKFYQTEGKRWHMGLSKYSSGRIHIDAKDHRTWGNDGTYKTSYCKG